MGEEDFTTPQEKLSLEEDIAGREKVRLNYWRPLDFMARYCPFPRNELFIPAPPTSHSLVGPTQLKASKQT